jgi:acetyl-CoA carboxylase biotin carboxylase subunit
MGDKNAAREQARKAGVPVCPGSDGIIDSEKSALAIAKKIGYPVMLKAVAGGGGRGMRPAHNDGSLIQAFHSARTEAEKAFGNGDVYIEKLIEHPHHIEFQVIGDSHGRLVHLGERDCSIQRRNQKIVEECPSQLLDADLRKRMGQCSVELASLVGYENAGTIEYLVDKQGNFYFMEMNTRIQVEHPVTEEVYGCDLVREQIQIAAGEHLSQHVAEARPRSHAIECRINAEDPDNNYTVPPYYDSMIAKLICVGSTRYSTVRRMARALSEYLITGIKTTIPFHVKIMQDAAFLRGEFDTGFVERLVGMKHLDISK